MYAIRNALVHTVSGEPIEKGTVLTRGSRIEAVGPEVRIPEEAKVVDGAGSCVFPGLIDAHAHVGIGGEGLGRRFGDGNEVLEPIQPHLRAVDAIWHDDPAFAEVLGGGVTTVFVCPGSVNVFGGVGVAVKTRPGAIDDRVVTGTEGMKMALGENVKRVHTLVERYPTTRMGIAALAREILHRARAYGRRVQEDGAQGESDFQMEALQPLLRREMKARVHAHRADDILTAIRIAEEFDLDLVVEHCTEGYLVRETLAEKGIPAVAGPHLGGRSKPETARRTIANVSMLHEAGVRVAIMTDAGSAAQFLPIHASVAVREGLPPDAGLRAVTLSAAEIIGAGDRLGSIEPGKDADLVVLPGVDPLEVRVKPTYVFVEGVMYPGSRGGVVE
ncbi:MAG: amidohydrolase [Planctomycetota bacterium]|jgi:imidazolonepropionase-like amidohydrolase